jgi:hypothetical protein
MIRFFRALFRRKPQQALGPTIECEVREDPTAAWLWRVYLKDGTREIELCTGHHADHEQARAAMIAEFNAEARRRGGVMRAAKAQLGDGLNLIGVRTEDRLELRVLAPEHWARDPVDLVAWISTSDAQIADVFVSRTGREAWVYAGDASFRVRADEAPAFASALLLPFEEEA